MVGDLRSLLGEKGIELHTSEELLGYIAEKSYSVKYGARNMRRFIQTELEDRIAELIIARRGDLTSVDADVSDGGITVSAK